MKHTPTARRAGLMSGSKAYQQQARAALPLLVRQSEAEDPIYYSDLAKKLNMPNPRNLNNVLGCIGRSLENLSKEWNEEIPPIQCLVLNKRTKLPGSGIGWFLIKKEEFGRLPLHRRQEIVQSELPRIYSYRRWHEVLDVLGLKPSSPSFEKIIAAAAAYRGGGESEHHRKLKEFVAMHPEIVNLPPSSPKGDTEFQLPSGDSLDVSFARGKMWVAAEVKSLISSEDDLARGIFQCVKYRAVMNAVLATKERVQNARVFLVLEGTLPEKLRTLRNLLRVDVIERVTPDPA
jgi:hypothetical protein